MIDRMQGMESGLGAQAGQLKETALDFAATARERLEKGFDSVRHFTTQQPAKALGVALGMGVLLGWLIKRR